MSRQLIDALSESDIDHILSCSAQRLAAARISSLVAELRGLTDADHYFEFQRELFGEIFEAENEASNAQRNGRRQRSGKPTPDCPSPAWPLEELIWRRIATQFRTVGDALAWRLFGFDRRIIIALSQNDQSGTMAGKSGLGHELGAVVAYHEEGTFALLHGVTNCLRIADLTAFEPEMPMIQEIKANAATSGSRHRAQIRRAQHAVEVINHGAPLGPNQDAELFVSTQQLKTRHGDLRKEIRAARQQAIRSVALGDQHVLTTFNGFGGADEINEPVREAERLKRRAFGRAHLLTTQHHLTGHSFDAAGRAPSLAPPTIFPLAPDEVAGIVAGVLAYETTIGWDRLAREFEQRGFAVTTPLESASGALDPGAPVLVASRGDRTVTVRTGAVVQLLMELLDIDRYVAAVCEYALAPREGALLPGGIVTFSNERAVWR